MSLTKIPLIVLATWGFTKAITSPNPPPPENERIASQVLMENFKYTPLAAFTMIALQWFVAIVEITTILAAATPSWPLSKVLLLLLVWEGGKPENICISKPVALGITAVTLGAWIRLMCFRYLGQFFRFEASIQKDHELIISGPYSIVRHPSYTGMILIFIGWLPWQISKGSWIVESGLWYTMLGRALVVAYFGTLIPIYSHYMLARMTMEDTALGNRFGTKWDDWVKRVPYSLVPGIY